MDDESTPTLAEFWEARYAGTGQVWSGRANRAMVDVVSSLPAGRALDLGCGEGGDAIWLAQHGWRVTGVDVSLTAIARARDAAEAAGVPADHIRFLAADLGSWREDGNPSPYDLVTASFLHSPVEIPRADILRHAASLVAPGGHLLILSHASAPPWSAHQHDYRFLTPTEEIDALDLPVSEWTVRIAETRAREATGPDGQRATMDDVVVLMHRADSA
jgi:SAM-dependent methyltransferase